MIAHINLDDRLSILRVGDPSRSWNSLDDRRLCVLCGRKFKGRQVDIRRLPRGKLKLCCPTLGCLSTPQQWHYARPAVPSDRVETTRLDGHHSAAACNRPVATASGLLSCARPLRRTSGPGITDASPRRGRGTCFK